MPTIDLDFTGVETSPGYLAPGVYRARLDKCEQKDGKKYPGLKLSFVSEEPETFGQRSEMFVSLAPQALWKVYLTLEGLGVPVSKEKLRLNTDKLIGRLGLVKVIDEPWTDAAEEIHHSSKVESVFPVPATATTPAAQAAAPAPEEEPPPDDFAPVDFGDEEGVYF